MVVYLESSVSHPVLTPLGRTLPLSWMLFLCARGVLFKGWGEPELSGSAPDRADAGWVRLSPEAEAGRGMLESVQLTNIRPADRQSHGRARHVCVGRAGRGAGEARGRGCPCP